MRAFLLLTILLFVVSNRTYGQKRRVEETETINRFDERGRKQGKWVDSFGETGRMEYNYKNGKKDGEYRFFNANNQLEEQGFYKEGKAVGKTSVFRNGRIWRSWTHKKGKSGPPIDYFENGQPKEGGDFCWGDGTVIKYDSLGFALSKKTYKNFKLNGPFEYYYLNGQLKERGIYKNNKYWTIEAKYDSLGNNISFGTIKSGDGYVYDYSDSGRTVRREYKSGNLWNVFRYVVYSSEYDNIGDFKNGNGVLKEYRSYGRLISEETYKNGLRNGTCKYYDGDYFDVGECVNDNKEGKWLRYHKGRIQNIIDYKLDRQVGIACFQ